jgi:FAD-dependent oxidoreductase domain-containing protein 1
LNSRNNSHCDVLVIGAGVVGLSIAYHIKENHRDLSVKIIDRRNAPGQEDTAKSLAAVRDTFTSDANRLLARSSIDFYKHVQMELGFNLNLEFIGYLWLLSKSKFAEYEAIENEMREQGTRVRVVEHDELAELIPDLVLDPSSEQSKLMGLESVYHGLHGLDCGTISPDLLVRFYETELKKRNVEFQFGTEAKLLRLEAKNRLGLPGEPFLWQDKRFKEVETNHSIISADTIVLAAGTRTPFLLDPLGIDCLIKPWKNQVFQMRGNSLQRLLATKGFNAQNTVPLTILPNGVYFRPVRGEQSFWVMASTGMGEPFMLEEEPFAYESHYTYNVSPILCEYFPCFANLRPVNSWAGFYDFNSLDATPIIQRFGNCILATGMSGSGIMKADSVGRIAAAVFEGKEYATLFGSRQFSTSRLGLTNRMVGKEGFVI